MERRVVQPASSSAPKMMGSLGVVIDYDRYTNTCTVAITEGDTNNITEILQNVVCPTQIGVQSAAPEPGRLCWVSFKNGNLTQPLIVNFYNHRYEQNDYDMQTQTPFSIPSYLMD